MLLGGSYSNTSGWSGSAQHNGGGFEACGHSCLCEGQVINVRKDPRELVSTYLDVVPRNASSLACIDLAQCTAHICAGDLRGRSSVGYLVKRLSVQSLPSWLK